MSLPDIGLLRWRGRRGQGDAEHGGTVGGFGGGQGLHRGDLTECARRPRKLPCAPLHTTRGGERDLIGGPASTKMAAEPIVAPIPLSSFAIVVSGPPVWRASRIGYRLR